MFLYQRQQQQICCRGAAACAPALRTASQAAASEHQILNMFAHKMVDILLYPAAIHIVLDFHGHCAVSPMSSRSCVLAGTLPCEALLSGDAAYSARIVERHASKDLASR
jgi:hypothetical protein